GGASLLAGTSFLAKFDSSINHSWSKPIPVGDQIGLIASDPLGNVFIGGKLGSSVDIDGHNVTGGVNSMFVAKFDTLGIFQWAQPTDDTKTISPQGLTADSNGNAPIVGWTFGDVDFGNGLLTSTGQDSNTFLVKYGPQGGPALWSKLFGGPGQHDPTA